MKANMTVRNMQSTRILLRNLADKVPDGARKVMHKSAEEILRVAKIQTPRDVGNLEDSIRILKSYGYRGRLQIDIGIEPTGDLFSASGTPLTPSDVNRYAALVHENYESVTRKNGPGKRTLKKMAQYPGYVIGSGFLTRAADDQEKKLAPQMIKVIEQIIVEEDHQ